jgi:hypothetical protein
MKKILIAGFTALTLVVAGCATLDQPKAPVPTEVDSRITSAFMTVNLALTAAQFIPNISPDVLMEARSLDAALQKAYLIYKDNPNQTNKEVLEQIVYVTVKDFLVKHGYDLTKK